MGAALAAIALGLPAMRVPAQSSQDFEKQVERGVADMSRSRVKQLSSGEWLRERLQVDRITQPVQPPETAGTLPAGVFTARILVHRSLKVPEEMARVESLPTEATAKRYEVEMHFEPDVHYGQWAFVGGRYWILDDKGERRLELTMFSDLLRDAPLDAPHELAWAIMSP